MQHKLLTVKLFKTLFMRQKEVLCLSQASRPASISSAFKKSAFTDGALKNDVKQLWTSGFKCP